MSWRDILCPGNPKKRDKILHLCSKLVTLLESNFKRTNELIDCIHKNVPGKTFSKIHLIDDDSLKNNSQFLICRLEEIKVYLEKRLKQLGETIDPAIYMQLTSSDMTIVKSLHLARTLDDPAIKIVGGVSGVCVIIWIRNKNILVCLSARLGTLMTCCFDTVTIRQLTDGANLLGRGITGAKERERLREGVMDIEATVEKFEPASDDFNRSIDRLLIRLED